MSDVSAVTALVGPLSPVRYATGPTRWHDLPRSTLDIRYTACGSHHLACDCREAMLAEDAAEWRAMYRQLESALLTAIKGHPTWAYDERGFTDEAGECKCPPCLIARETFTGYTEWATAARKARGGGGD